MHSDIKEILITADEIDAAVGALADRLTADYAGKRPLLLCILKGSAIFMSDLVRKMPIDLELAFIIAKSYGSCSVPGQLVIEGALPDLSGRDVVIVEDIIDTGHTLLKLQKHVAGCGAKSVEICALLDKPSRREVPVDASYIGIEVPNEFVVGYGLDYNEKYRNLPYVGALKEQLYKN